MLVKADINQRRSYKGRTYSFQKDHLYNIPKELGRILQKDGSCSNVEEKYLNNPFTDYELNPPRLDLELMKENYLVILPVNIKLEDNVSFAHYKTGEIISLEYYRAEKLMKDNCLIPFSAFNELIGHVTSKAIADRQQQIKEAAEL